MTMSICLTTKALNLHLSKLREQSVCVVVVPSEPKILRLVSRNMTRIGFCALEILTSTSAMLCLQMQGLVFLKCKNIVTLYFVMSQVPLGSSQVDPKEISSSNSLRTLLPSRENSFLLVPGAALFQRLDRA